MPRVEITDYEPQAKAILAIRFEVFVNEQCVPSELEVDGRDPDCIHALAFYEDKPVGTGRLLPDGHIGRVAVLKAYRNKGIGGTIMKRLIEEARKRGFEEALLSSQTAAIRFYERLGFVSEGEVYLEAGIDHIDMRLEL
jgi:predicted GNAT family N-acyltransferase